MKFCRIKLKTIRDGKKLTQLDLADKINTTQAIISMIESGKIENPSIGLITKVCMAMQIDIHEILILNK